MPKNTKPNSNEGAKVASSIETPIGWTVEGFATDSTLGRTSTFAAIEQGHV